MLKPVFIAVLLVTSTMVVCSAQSDVAKDIAADGAVVDQEDSDKGDSDKGDSDKGDSDKGDSDKGDSILDAAEAEYRELICSRAADFSDANQEAAIRFAVEQNYVDERFNASICNVLKEASKPDHWDVERLSRAVQLLPLSTLGGKERTELVFRCYLCPKNRFALRHRP